MNTPTVSYFVEKFQAYDAEELGDLVSRRSDLSDEAMEALDLVLSEKGLKVPDVSAAPQAHTPLTPEQEVTHLREQTESSRTLWRSWLSNTCKLLVALIFITPAQSFLQTVTYGAVWEGLTILIAGYVGYSIGREVTKAICANAEVLIQVKKKSLWMMLLVLCPVYLVVYVVSHAFFGRG